MVWARGDRSWQTEHRRDLRGVALAVAFLTVLLMLPGFLPGRAFHYGDWTTYFLPLRNFLADAWKSGDPLPLWWSALLGGFPVAANPQFGLFYPPNWLLALLPLGNGLALIMAAHAVWGGLGMSVLMLNRGAARAPAILAAIVYAAAGPVVSASSAVNLSLAMAWLPWILHWFPAGLAPEGTWARRFAALGLAAMLFAGGIEILLWTVMLLPFWSYASAPGARRPATGPGEPLSFRQRVMPVARGMTVVGAMALLLAAVQLLPALELFAGSTRLEGISPAEAQRFLAPPGRLTGLLLPWVTWEPASMTSWVELTGDVRAHYLPSLYVGLTVLILAMKGFERAPRGERGVLAWVGVLGLLFGVGSGLPLIGAVADLVPGSGLYRFDEKYLLLIAPALAWFSAWGLQASLETGRAPAAARGKGRPAWKWLIVGAAAGLALMLALLIAGPGRCLFLIGWNGQSLLQAGGSLPIIYQGAQLTGLLLTSSAALFSALLLRGAARRRISAGLVGVLLLLLVGSEYLVTGHRFFRSTDLSRLMTPGATGAAVLDRGIAGRSIRWELIDEEEGPLELFSDPARQLELYHNWLVPNLAPMQGIPAADGSSAIRLHAQAYAESSWRAAGPATRLPFAGAIGARYLLLSDLPQAVEIQMLPGAVPLYPTATTPPDTLSGVPPMAVIEYPAALQPIQMIYDWRKAPDPRQAIHTLRTSGLRPDRQVVLSPGPLQSAADSTLLPDPPPAGLPEEEPAWRVRLLHQSDEAYGLRVTTPLPGLLIRVENAYPGWEAFVDDAPVRLWSANAVLQAIQVPAGSFDVTFRFRSRGLGIGAILTLAGLVWLLLPALRRTPHQVGHRGSSQARYSIG